MFRRAGGVPIGGVHPGDAVHLDVQWLPVPMLPLTAFTGSALGLVMGTKVEPRKVPLLFGVVLSAAFLGATYYPWALLHDIRWLQIVMLVNPLVLT